MSAVRVLVLYNQPVLPPDDPDADAEHDILRTVDVVEKTLSQAGYESDRLGVGYDPMDLLHGVRDFRPDAVFNLFEGLADFDNTEAVAAGFLDWMGIPYTGSPYPTLSLGLDKAMTKRVFQGAGLPTADFFAVDSEEVPDCNLRWPVIVKSATRDASLGLDQGSVVTDQKSLADRVAYIRENYETPALVEEFITGREFNVGIVETPEVQVLPLAEILFLDKDPNYWPVLTYNAKWRTGSYEDEMTPPRCPADVEPVLADRLASLAIQAYRLLDCRDYARVDFRVDPAGQPYLLEINPNPDCSPTAGLARMIRTAGMTYEQFVIQITRNALQRKGRTPGPSGETQSGSCYATPRPHA